MRTWLGSLVFVVLGTFALASGCSGKPEVVSNDGNNGTGALSGDGNASAGTGNGTGASGGLFFGDGGDGNHNCVSTCEDLNANCGYVTDTLCDGALIQCGTCKKAGEFCGGDGPSRCGTGLNGDAGACSGDCMSCTPKTCADLGFTCGPAGDTCGGKLDCGPSTCPILGFTCGGGGKIGECGCSGACSNVPDCSAKPIKTTTLTGKVYDPAGNNPLYHVFVYVANNPADPNLKTFPAGITCDVCGATAAGDPLLSEGDQFGTYTGVDGSFELKNVPVAKGVTVVIQLGRWRRVFTVDIDKPCAPNAIPDKTFLMPSKQSQGNIPLMAMVTGDADSLECVLRKMGIDKSEFTNPADGGRVQFYLGTGTTDTNGKSGQAIDQHTPAQSQLFVNGAAGTPVINDYDMTILACQGDHYAQSAANQTSLRNYAAAGGRVFTTHFSYTWLAQNDANTAQKGKADNWSEVATWKLVDDDRADHATGHIDLMSNPKGSAFQGWLEAVNASTPGSGTTEVDVIRHDTNSISSVDGQTQRWLYRDCTDKMCSVNTALDCTKNANVCLPKVCKNKPSFPACTQNSDCGGNNNCVTQSCVAVDCAAKNPGKQLPLHFTYNTPVNTVQDLTTDPPTLQCGRVLFSDFHVQDAHENGKIFPEQCGIACTTDNQCAIGGKCVAGNCLDPMTPQEKLLEFMIFDLGSCVPPPKACVPATKCPAGADCGYAPDGCGGLISCGECPTGEACGVGNPPVPNKCGKGTTTCIPQTCAVLKLECGPAADGCGDKIDSCGTCSAGELCVQGKCAHVN
jgi:hypothetical protein